MPKRLSHFLLLVLLATSFAPKAEAGPYAWIMICGEHMKHFAVKHFSLVLAGRNLTGTVEGTGEKITLNVGKRLGYGFVGGVYDVDITRADGTVVKDTLVAKSAHRFRVLGQPNILVRNINQEIGVQGNLQALLPALQKNPLYPKSYPKNVLPLAPIAGLVKTNKGMVLLKRKLKGLTVADFGRKNAGEPYGSLPPDMEQGLKDMHAFAKAVEAESAKTGKAISLDVNPNNLMWVTDRALLAEMGFKHPAFIAFEITEANPGLGPGDWASYRELFVEYSRMAVDTTVP